MTSSNNSRLRLLKIEKADLDLHYFLSDADECYYIYEYTSGRNYDFSPVNSLINNLKKCPERFRGTASWKYKEGAVRQCGEAFKATLHPKFIEEATLVPVPPSKTKDDPKYDDRMIRVAKSFSSDVRSMVIQTESTTASHLAGDGQRTSIEELVRLYEIDETLTAPAPKIIAIVDDVVTNGRHFVAMKRVLQTRFPKVPIIGLFVARRVFPTEAEIDVDDLF